MPTFRVEKTQNYTVMSNYHLRDLNLSNKARGLLSTMLSLPENWDYTTRGLARICKDGVDSICSQLKELEAAGYLVRRRTRTDNGQLGEMEYIIYEKSITNPSPDDDGDKQPAPTSERKRTAPKASAKRGRQQSEAPKAIENADDGTKDDSPPVERKRTSSKASAKREPQQSETPRAIEAAGDGDKNPAPPAAQKRAAPKAAAKQETRIPAPGADAAGAPHTGNPDMDNPDLDNPDTGKPVQGFPAQRNIDIRNKDLQNTVSLIDSFASLQEHYVGRDGGGNRSEAKRVQEEREMLREEVLDNVCYDDFEVMMPERKLKIARDLVHVLVDAVCTTKPYLRISGEDRPASEVREQLLKVRFEHIECIVDNLNANTTSIRNMHQYMLAALYNAPATYETQLQAMVQHDDMMYRRMLAEESGGTFYGRAG